MQLRVWDYQFEEREHPWAICAILTFPRGSPEKKRVAFDVYCELIPNEARLVRLEAKRYVDEAQACGTLTDMIACFSEVSERDAKQLRRFVKSILAKEQTTWKTKATYWQPWQPS